jgi:hypothetical protein
MSFISFWPVNTRPWFLRSAQARLNILLRGPLRYDNIIVTISCFFPFGLSPHSTNAPLFDSPRQRGYEEQGKEDLRHCPPASWSCLRHSFLFCRVTTEALSTLPQQTSAPLHPVHEHGIQWRTSPSPDRLRPLGWQGRYRDWYAHCPLSFILSLYSPPAHSISTF